MKRKVKEMDVKKANNDIRFVRHLCPKLINNRTKNCDNCKKILSCPYYAKVTRILGECDITEILKNITVDYDFSPNDKPAVYVFYKENDCHYLIAARHDNDGTINVGEEYNAIIKEFRGE